MTAETCIRHYCPRCGGRMFEDWDDEVRATCLACGYSAYRPVVAESMEALMAEVEAMERKYRHREPRHGGMRLD